MTPTLEALEAAALGLSAAERAELIQRLIDTLPPPHPLHPAWEAEMARRIADLDSGCAKAIPAEAVRAEMRAMIEAVAPGKPGA